MFCYLGAVIMLKQELSQQSTNRFVGVDFFPLMLETWNIVNVLLDQNIELELSREKIS